MADVLKTIFYVDRTGWARGPWDNEPDGVIWQELGYYLFALRHESWGDWRGYIAVPPGHPFYSVTQAPECLGHMDCTGRPAWLQNFGALEIPLNDWWAFGFDCGHGLDLCPGLDANLRQRQVAALDPELAEFQAYLADRLQEIQAELDADPMPWEVYRTLDSVRERLSALARKMELAKAAARS